MAERGEAVEITEEVTNLENGMPDLEPCPFCGSLGVAVVGFAARCGSCGAVGPFGPTAMDAAERWNARSRLKGQGPGNLPIPAADDNDDEHWS